MALIKCPECGNDVSSTARNCPHCGCPSSNFNKVCPDCGKVLSSKAISCPNCGAVLSRIQNKAPSPNFQYETDTNVITIPAPSASDCIRMFIKRGLDFSGRSRRSEFWWVCLLSTLLFSPMLYFALIQKVKILELHYIPLDVAYVYYIVYALYFIAAIVMMVPTAALMIRRLHDINFSGFVFLIVLLPIVGNIILLFIMCMDSKKGSNQYGASPKYKLN